MTAVQDSVPAQEPDGQFRPEPAGPTPKADRPTRQQPPDEPPDGAERAFPPLHKKPGQGNRSMRDSIDCTISNIRLDAPLKILVNIKVTAPVNDGRDKKEKQKKN